MRKIVLLTAITIDGYIAKKNGSIDWLSKFDEKYETEHCFSDFYKAIDTTLIGNNTYRQIIAEGNQTPFSDKENYVFSKDTDNRNTENEILGFINEIKKEQKKISGLLEEESLIVFSLKNH